MNKNNQQGISLLGLLVIITFICGGYFLYQYISKTNNENKEQANKIQSALSGDEYDGNYDVDNKTVDDLKVQSGAREHPIRTVSVAMDEYHVLLRAKLPGTFTGVCRALVQRQDGSEVKRYFEDIEHQSSCEITSPKEKLGLGEWEFFMSFESGDGSSWGKHTGSSFKL